MNSVDVLECILRCGEVHIEEVNINCWTFSLSVVDYSIHFAKGQYDIVIL